MRQTTRPRSRNLRRLIARLQREHGDIDHCHGCGRGYDSYDITSVGYSDRGELLQVGGCCTSRLATLVGGSVYFAADSALAPWLKKAGSGMRLGMGTRWSEDDRAWFEEHPARSHRLRRAHAGEWPKEAGNTEYTVVKQVEPGGRLRRPLALTGPLPQEGEVPEAAAWAIFDLIEEATATGGRTVSVEAIIARWRRYESDDERGH
jgi:hypothetical protein